MTDPDVMIDSGGVSNIATLAPWAHATSSMWGMSRLRWVGLGMT
jgi:hypothetical protein